MYPPPRSRASRSWWRPTTTCSSRRQARPSPSSTRCTTRWSRRSRIRKRRPSWPSRVPTSSEAPPSSSRLTCTTRYPAGPWWRSRPTCTRTRKGTRMDPIVRDKAEYHAKTSADMDRFFKVPDWSPQQKMALACRILAGEGHESGLAGQITARGPRPGTYWMLSFGLGFDEATAANIVLCDDDLNLLQGDGFVNPSNRFHLWIYRHRPQVNAIIHTHPPYCSALSLVGEPLKVAHMDTTMFHEDCAYLPEWPGVPIGDEEGRIIHEALGDKRAILRAHHGQLTACATMEEATVLATFIERAARMQILASCVGKVKPINPEFAKEAHDYRLKPKAQGATFHYFARRVIRETP